jgi:hypothetical protein
MRRAVSVLVVGCALAASAGAAAPAAASAAAPGARAVRADFSITGILGSLCGVAGDSPGPVGVLGKVCSGASKGSGALSAGGKLLGGIVGGGGGGVARTALTAAGLAAIGLWAAHGAQAALREAAHVIGSVTDPQLRSTWFSATYWRVAGLAALLTVPFLFAASIQALIRTDLALLVRAAFGYLPLAMLAVSIAAPVTMLLLAASDQMSSAVSATAGDGGGRFLTLLGGSAASLGGFAGSTFLALFLGVVIVGAATALTLELLLREAAVYVVVLMLPLAFAAMVWPARRVWAVRLVELLVALILSKFVIVAVLTLAEGALGQLGSDGIGTVLAGMTLLLLATFSPWVLLKLIPFAEVGAGIGGALSGERDRFTRFATSAGGFESMLVRSDAEPVDRQLPALPDGQPPSPADDGHGHGHPGFGPDAAPPGGGTPGGGGVPGGGAPGGEGVPGGGTPDGGGTSGGGAPSGQDRAADPQPSRVAAAGAELRSYLAPYADDGLPLGPREVPALASGGAVAPEGTVQPAGAESPVAPAIATEQTRMPDPAPGPVRDPQIGEDEHGQAGHGEDADPLPQSQPADGGVL